MELTRRHLIARAAVLGAAATAPALAGAAAGRDAPATTERWGIYEIALNGPGDGPDDNRGDDRASNPGANPFAIDVAATFRRADGAGQPIRVPGFYDGDGVYRIRFSPPAEGRWLWTTGSTSARLAGQEGAFMATPPGARNHGPVGVSADGYHFVYADGTPFRQIGTTCYSWAQQTDARCRTTLATLAQAPFNKIRMLVFPNVEAVATNPFRKTGVGPRDWDPTRFDPAYFRRYEDRIVRLQQLGIEADIILFHPYDPGRGYSDMKRADDERYIRYAAARFGAFRNVWWSMANEYDAIKTKDTADWDHLFQVLVAADPHQRLRSIHQINIYYDQRKPWITHASIQNNAAVLDDIRAELHRSFALKPVIFDEAGYEGDIDKRWGNLAAETMVERFWWGLVGGTYVGHSETFAPDRNADHSWLGQGGTLRGESAPRLQFLKKLMAAGPVPGIEPIQPWWNYHIGGQEDSWFLKYFGAAEPAAWPIVLPGRRKEAERSYRAEILDTWAMTATPVDGLFPMERRNEYEVHCPSRPTIALPGRKWMALKLVGV